MPLRRHRRGRAGRDRPLEEGQPLAPLVISATRRRRFGRPGRRRLGRRRGGVRRTIGGVLVIGVPALIAGIAVALLTEPGPGTDLELGSLVVRGKGRRRTGTGPTAGGRRRACCGFAPRGTRVPVQPVGTERRRARGAADRPRRVGPRRSTPGRAGADGADRPPRLAGGPRAVRRA